MIIAMYVYNNFRKYVFIEPRKGRLIILYFDNDVTKNKILFLI